MAAFGFTSTGQPKGPPMYSSGEGIKPTTQGAYTAAIGQTGKDYDSIMQNYRDMYAGATGRSAQGGDRFSFQRNTSAPREVSYMAGPSYSRSGDMADAMGRAKGFADTGGYSAEDIGSMRARGISPIRSIYANAQRNLERQKALQGGYSPNYGAASSKMARESSDLIADRTTDVNARLAEMIQAGKLAGSRDFASLASRDNELTNQSNQRLTDAQNRIAELNAANTMRWDEMDRAGEMETARMNEGYNRNNLDDAFRSTQGMQSLYGTTPALASTFGQQALQDRGQSDSYSLNRGNQGLDMIGRSYRG